MKGLRRSKKVACKLLMAAGTIVLMFTVQSGHAQTAPDAVATGKKLAEQYCIQCHVVVPSGKPGWTDAPAFDVIANRPGVSATKLSATAQNPHMHMLNDQRPKPEADAIAAYIISLRRR